MHYARICATHKALRLMKFCDEPVDRALGNVCLLGPKVLGADSRWRLRLELLRSGTLGTAVEGGSYDLIDPAVDRGGIYRAGGGICLCIEGVRAIGPLGGVYEMCWLVNSVEAAICLRLATRIWSRRSARMPKRTMATPPMTPPTMAFGLSEEAFCAVLVGRVVYVLEGLGIC